MSETIKTQIKSNGWHDVEIHEGNIITGDTYKCKQFIKNFPRLEIIKEKRMDFIVYPLSGGFHNPSLSPPFMWDALDYFERLLSPLDRYLAFRLFVVIERI